MMNSEIFGEEITIDSTFSTSCEIFPFGEIGLITSLSLTADIKLNHDTSLVRIIFVPYDDHEYMILEAYPLIAESLSFSVHEVCDETCFVNQLRPYSLKIQIIDAEVKLNSLDYFFEELENLPQLQFEVKRDMDEQKIEMMNVRIPAFYLNWTAGNNNLVALYYHEKKQLFGDGYNIRGFDYYQDGIFKSLGLKDYAKGSPNLVRQFDWRDRHGANDSLSPYYDNDLSGSGWITSVKNQLPETSCYAFGPIGTTEALANVFSNSHVDLDLSERYFLACFSGYNSGIQILSLIQDTGSVTENCLPYSFTQCNQKCNPIDPIIRISDTLTIYSESVDSIRTALITRGPLMIHYTPPGATLSHSALIAGYFFNHVDSTIIWIIKNSFGIDSGQKGYDIMPIENIHEVYAAVGPVTVNNTELGVNCYDKDFDGYCFWGIGPKPDNCECSDTTDCDDSNWMLGGYDENYNCTCLLVFDSALRHIDTDTTWSDSIYVNQTVIIDSGACLTIETVALFSSPAKIIVKQGGKLVIDGGKLTNACPDELWDGVEVWGSDTNQYFYQFFGVVNISNGGTIENARTAIANYCKTCEQYSDEAGGVIRTENAIFRNNRIAVNFAPFKNLWQGQEQDYRATFDKTIFIYDNYLNDFSDFEYFIKMQQVRGVKFYGCEFLCDTNSIHSDKEKTYKYRSGIYSMASQFYVEDACISQTAPCTQFKPSIFKELNYGIYALDVDGRKTATIKRSRFENNITGIFLSAMDNSSIAQDTFVVSTGNFHKRDTICGLYLDFCTGYQIEENNFETTYSSIGNNTTKVGLFINSSGPYANEVYKNKFNYLKYGIVAMNENKKDSVGLCIKCNTFENCFSDISVVIDTAVRGWGIAEYQGSSQDTTTAPAGNVFTSDEYQDHYFDLFNDVYADPFTYIHHNEVITPEFNVKPDPEKCSESVSLVLNDQEYDPEESCPSHLGSTINSSMERSIMEEAEYQIASIESSLDLLVDGGNTQILNMDVITSTPPEAIDITNHLLSESPFLSDTVMKSAIEKEDVLSNAMIRDVLVENPQSAKSPEILQLIDDRQDPMPDYMKSQITQGKYITGDKENLEAERSNYSSEQARAFNNLYRYFQTDTLIVNPRDSLMILLNEFNRPEYWYRRTFVQLEIGDTNQARTTLDYIPLAFSLDAEELNAQQDCEDLLEILIDLQISESSGISLDSLQVLQLLDICNNRSLPGIYARNLLVASGILNYEEPFLFPDNMKKQEVKPWPLVNVLESAEMRVFPNPAMSYCIIEFKVNGSKALRWDNPDISIHIHDVMGTNIISLVSDQVEDQILLNVSTLKPGMYFVKLVIDGQIKNTSKLIIYN
jgi:hypothetical protein